jgi:hypothetical protein
MGTRLTKNDSARSVATESKQAERRPVLERLEPRLLLNAYLVTNLADAGAGSLRAAIAAADSHIGADVVQFQPGLSGTIALTSGELEISGDELMIDGPGDDVITVSGSNSSRVFHVETGFYGEPVTIRGLTIRDGNVVAYGASFDPADGGGILCLTTPLTVEDCSILFNTAHATDGHAHGGGLSSDSSELTIRRCTFGWNEAFSDSQAHGGYGGGLRAVTFPVTIEDSGFASNSADWGGGIDLIAEATMARCEVGLNTARHLGGGIRNSGGTLLLNDCNVYWNNAPIGGGIDVLDELIVTNDSMIAWNTAEHAGGIYQNDGSVTVINSTITGNEATNGSGGGIGVSEGDLTRLLGSTVSGNTASVEGGGIQLHTGTMELANTTISGNSARENGGGISLYSYQMTATNVTITDNQADSDWNGSGSGGGVHIPGTAWAILYNTILAGNMGTGGSVDNLFGTLHASSSHNYVGSSPSLLPLSDNGGPTLTHALQAASPAIDSGSNAQAGNAGLVTDQRGFYRLVDGDNDGRKAVDIGAFEYGAIQAIPGDANGDGAVTDADYTIWADHYGQCGVGVAQGDFNGDGCVTDADYTIWADHYGVGGGATTARPTQDAADSISGNVSLMGLLSPAGDTRTEVGEYSLRDDTVGARDSEFEEIDLLAILSVPEVL